LQKTYADQLQHLIYCLTTKKIITDD
jgi:hypothetical protein